MFKKAFITGVILMFGASGAFAAGGEINAKIQQKNTVDNSKVIGASSAAIDLEKIPVLKHVLSGKIDGTMSANTIDNAGKLNGEVFQTSNMKDAVVVSSQINSLKNEKGSTISSGSMINQKNDINNQSVVVGATINHIRNHK